MRPIFTVQQWHKPTATQYPFKSVHWVDDDTKTNQNCNQGQSHAERITSPLARLDHFCARNALQVMVNVALQTLSGDEILINGLLSPLRALTCSDQGFLVLVRGITCRWKHKSIRELRPCNLCELRLIKKLLLRTASAVVLQHCGQSKQYWTDTKRMVSPRHKIQNVTFLQDGPEVTEQSKCRTKNES